MIVRPSIDNDEFARKYIRWKQESRVGQSEAGWTAFIPHQQKGRSRAELADSRELKMESRSSLIHKLSLKGVANQLRCRFHPGFLEDARAIGAHGLYAEGDFVRNLLDGLTGSDHSQHLKLAI
jgi:hypothetical protein